MRELVDLVLGDLQGSEPIAVQVGWDPTPAGMDQAMPGEELCSSPMLMFSEPGEQGGVGWTPAAPGVGGEREWGDEFTLAEMAFGLADYLQEQFFPETRAAWAQARPSCPGHRHPATAQLLDGDA